MASKTATTTTITRLRVDTVGSFLRPERLRRAFEEFMQGQCTADSLERTRDDCIRELVSKQEAHDLPIATDGEFRRFNYMESFAVVSGLEKWKASWPKAVGSLAEGPSSGPPRQGVNPLLGELEGVTGRLELIDNIPRKEFEFAKGLTSLPVKVPFINPDRVMQSIDVAKSLHAYSSSNELMDDTVRVAREIVDGLQVAGCEYIQLDAPGYTAYVDGPSTEKMRAEGEDPGRLLTRAIAADNAVMAGFDAVTFGVHMCRGNRQGQWHREGSYDPIAEQLFSELDCERFLLEYDDARSGSFEPLRFVPKGKVVVLGLITTKLDQLETKEELLRRIDEASQYLPVEQLALSPQCGFGSDLFNNSVTEDTQWRKIDLMLEVAAEVWPEQADAGRGTTPATKTD